MSTARLTIDLDALAANWRALDAVSADTTETAAVVKANGYGLGVQPVARALAKAGWSVTGLDLAPSSVPLAKRLADEEGLAIDYRVGDFLSDEPHQPFDLLFEHTLFCAIPPTRRSDYVQALRGWLKPGGLYLAVNYMITDDNGEPPFSTTTAELDARFGEPFELLRRWTPRSYESREGKELMNEWKMKG